MSSFTQVVRDLPLAGLAPAVLMIVAGLALWGAGRKMLRFGFAGAGVVAGAAIGWIAGDAIDLGVHPAVSAFAGAAALGCVAVLAYRLAVAGAMAAILALAAPLGVITAAELTGVPTTQEAAPDSQSEPAPADGPSTHAPAEDELTRWLREALRKRGERALKEAGRDLLPAGERQPANGTSDLPPDDQTGAAAPAVEAHARDLGHHLLRLIDAAWAQWKTTHIALRPKLIAAAIVGGAAGLILGVFAAKVSAAAITAFGGSLLWLTGLRIVAMRAGVPEGPWLPSSGIAFMSFWMAASIAGLVIQAIFHGSPKPPADK